jgi:glycosyltransferase involved in cell wall biosynthesis
MSLPSYILITSVKDEAAHLETVMASLCAQYPSPLRWYITDDGSSDATPEIIRSFLPHYPFIRLIQNPKKEGRSWGSQYGNMNKMYAQARKELGEGFDYVGVHDADVAVDEDFYTRLLTEAVRDESLGMIGGVVYQPRPRSWRSRLIGLFGGGVVYQSWAGGWQPRSTNASDSPPGSVLISRKCFDAVGGYVPKEYGESDWLFTLDARRLGFGVKVVPAAPLYEYRKTNSTTVKGSFKAGLMDASLGSDPLFELAKCARRALHTPLGLGGILRLAGYISYRATRKPSVGPERYNFLRSLQRAKLTGKGV